jgi:hypothetical protein
MASGIVNVPIYATLGRGDMLADGIVDLLAPASLRYGATKYSVMRSRDDRFSNRALFWFNSKDDWYRFWEGEEAIEFRARYSGKFQVPITYVWHDEIGADAAAPTEVRSSADVAIAS